MKRTNPYLALDNNLAKENIQKKKTTQLEDIKFCANKSASGQHCMNPATPALNVMRYISWLHKDEIRKKDVRTSKPTAASNVVASSIKIQSSNKNIWKRMPPPAHSPRSLHSVCNLVWPKKTKTRSGGNQAIRSQNSGIPYERQHVTVVRSSDTQKEKLSASEQVNDSSSSRFPEVVPTEEEVVKTETVSHFNTTANSKQYQINLSEYYSVRNGGVGCSQW